MDPRDVNRINFNNYYTGKNLDFLIRSKMRSESLSTPLSNTPVYYDDQVSSKMALLGKRGYYDPGYIYDLDNKSNQNKMNYNNKEQINNDKIIHNEMNRQMNNNGQNNDFKKEYYDYINNKNKMMMKNENDNINERYDLNLPKTKEQIQHEVFLENYKNQQLAEQMNRDEYMKYKQNLFRK